MNLRRLQGLALLVILPIDLLSFVAGDAPWFSILLAISVLLFMFGIPAIQSLQPMGKVGLVGIVLIELSALIALGINQFSLLEATVALVLTSVLAGALGRILVGWLTTRGSVFPAWACWAFLAQGVLNLAGFIYLYEMESLERLLATLCFCLMELPHSDMD